MRHWITNANLNRTVLIGHSMGGLICSTMIREGGDIMIEALTQQKSR